ncbi:MAG: hypothetical protein J6O50_13585 [Ruminiclostridium sp.]|nr:hypothetical protein [Ruminiclostridium sp.]
MKTDVYKFERSTTDIASINGLAEKAAQYCELDKKQSLKLMLLCEELVEMLPNLLQFGNGEFWIETDKKKVEIHSVVEADDLLTSLVREDILKVSSSGKNSAAKGIMNKIRIAAEVMLANYALTNTAAGTLPYDSSSFGFYDAGLADPYAGGGVWSLGDYRKSVNSDTEEWDELERSIIANIADDVTVGIIGGKVEITVKKKF